MTPVREQLRKGTGTKSPKYQVLVDSIRAQIRSGELNAGDRLPSFAEMRAHSGVTAITLERVYGLLEQEGLIERQPRRGVFVAERRKKRTGNIGLFLHSYWLHSSNNNYFQMLLSGIREGCKENGLNAILVEDEKSFDQTQLDGIVFYGDRLELYAMGLAPEIPLVMFFQHVNDINTVTIDDFGGFKMATSYLIRQGHRHIACLTADADDVVALRRSGYQAALREAGIAQQPHWLRIVSREPYRWDDDYLNWGRFYMKTWLDDNWAKLNCTAIVTQNDHAAIGIMQTLQEAGIDVPGQVSVVGFDGTELCDMVRPRLTSVEVPFYEMGREAIKVLLSQMENRPQTPREIVLPIKLREGDSVLRIHSKGRVK
jgi:DNA-binding LacI/PurR family transcriptional regulator